MDQAKVRVEAALLPPLGKSTREIIRSQLGGDGILLYLVKGIDEQIRMAEQQLRQTDLSSDGGVRAAIKHQGVIKGLEQAVTLIFTLAEKEFEND